MAFKKKAAKPAKLRPAVIRNPFGAVVKAPVQAAQPKPEPERRGRGPKLPALLSQPARRPDAGFPDPGAPTILDRLLELAGPDGKVAVQMKIGRPERVRSFTKGRRELEAGDQERLWAHVASLPCQFPGCGAAPVQISHSNFEQHGKGERIKAFPWMVAALCEPHHVAIDSGREFSREEKRLYWLWAFANTMSALFARLAIRPT